MDAIAPVNGIQIGSEAKNVRRYNHPHDHDHEHHGEHGHDHSHDHSELSDIALRVRALESILTEKGLVDPAAIDAIVETYETEIGRATAPGGGQGLGRSRLQAR